MDEFFVMEYADFFRVFSALNFVLAISDIRANITEINFENISLLEQTSGCICN